MPRAYGPVTIEVDGEQQVRLAVTRILREVQDLRPLWKRWQVAFFASEIDLFAAAPWASLDDRYAAWKAANLPGRGILVASGAMKNSLVSQGSGHIFRAQPRVMEIGTEVPYAMYHQRGTPKMPMRKPIDLTHGDAGSKAGHFGRALVEWGNELRKAWEQ